MRQLVIGILGSLLFWFHANATEQSPSSANDQGLKASAARARSGVLKVECLGQNGANSSAILSAVAIDDDGDLLTVGLGAPGDRRLCVWDCDGKRHDAQWVGADEESGLTLLKVKPGTVTAMPVADSKPEVGSMVIVVGNPLGLSHSVSFGNISGLDRTVNFSGSTGRRLIQFTAPIHPGDSGGLLADSQGRMVGIIRTA
ncbi:MAG: trypsin-like peptidase domain-containing protein, partial [Planctomycetes bacterium]|nr:trypsin-like peptidase domain-containing protein [Planctomycetota bacterium]